MNRFQRRRQAKLEKKAGHGVPKYSLHDVQRSMNIAMEMKKISKGHLFSKSLKERCIFCGATQRTKKICAFWFWTFMDRTQTVLINPSFFQDDEVQALWIQHGNEYKDVQFPLDLNP